jgi:aspartyl-tRNA(Asn)/glutamyl-tRNA(Gln) amidotransferase subunit A
MDTLALSNLTTAEAAERIARRQVSSVELVVACLGRIEALEPRLNCFITVCREEALAAAREADAALAAGGGGGPLHGVPVAVKDNVETAGVRATGGSRILADHVPAEDAPAWGRLRAAGAILLGKTNLHEFGMGATSLNPHYGPTRNPWDPARVPGGSSGGSAAAVAAGMAPASLGTDAGGSVRIPASLCGVVGLKPTHGLVPVRGGIAFSNPTVDQIGPLGRSVADVALLLSLMAGPDARDPTTREVPPDAGAGGEGDGPNGGDYVRAAARGAGAPDLRGLRIGVPEDHYFSPIHPDVEAAVRAAIAHLVGLGAEVLPVRLPDHEVLLGAMSGLGGERLAYHGRWLRTRLQDYAPEAQPRLLATQFILATDYAKALRARRLLRERYDAAFRSVDLLAAPTTPLPAPTIEEAERDAVSLGGRALDTGVLSRNTRPANLTGLPGISVPCGFAVAEGSRLPIGLMLLGRPFQEARLLHAAAAYEATTGWHREAPPL